MAPVNLEKLIPGLAELRQQERQNRALAFAGLTHTICGQEVLPLTPLHRLQLQLLGNAFTSGGEPTLVDVFIILWILSPHNRPGLEGARAQYFLREDVQRLDLAKTTREIYLYLIAQLQDSPETSGEGGTDQRAWIHWIAQDSSFWLDVHGGFTLEEYLRTPCLALQQLFRAWRCNHPDRSATGEVLDPQFINNSDAAIGRWQRERRDAVAEYIRNQHTRLN